jgi:hypothetical protein
MERLFNFKSATEVVNSKTNVGGSKTPTSLLGGHNLTAQSEDVNFYRNGSIDEHDDPYDNTMKLPIKNHIAKLEVREYFLVFSAIINFLQHSCVHIINIITKAELFLSNFFHLYGAILILIGASLRD